VRTKNGRDSVLLWVWRGETYVYAVLWKLSEISSMGCRVQEKGEVGKRGPGARSHAGLCRVINLAGRKNHQKEKKQTTEGPQPFLLIEGIKR